jgi:hypothetical protein
MEGTAVKKWHKRKNTAATLRVFVACKKGETYQKEQRTH